MKEPDLDRLRAVRKEMDDLAHAGKFTREAFDRLWSQAVEAANGHDECLEGIETVAIWYGVKL